MTHTIPNSTTANVRAEAARRGLTPHTLAQQIGMPSATFYKRLDRGDWRLTELQRIADALNITLSTLTGGDR